MPSSQGQLILLVHGIRDIGRWQAEVADTLEKAGFAVELTNYGRMNLLEFLLPARFFRRRAVETVWTQIQHAVMLHPGAEVSIIAHSFGTYIVASIMRRQFNLAVNRVIFCGSVVRFNFPFEQINERFNSPILNEVGTADPWPALAESVTTGYGSAGTYGFRRPGVKDRFYNGAGHGFFLSAQFCKERWIPFLENGERVPGDLPAKNPPLWVRLITIFKLKYVFVILFAVLLALLALGRMDPAPVQETDGFEIFNQDRVVDLSDWKEVPSGANDSRISKTVWHDRFKMRRLRADLRVFVMRRAVTGEIKPEFASPTHRIMANETRERPLQGPRPIDRLYDVLIDVSNEPVNEWFDVRVDSIYWNVFLTKDSQWVGIPVQFPTKSIRLELQSSARPFTAFEREAYNRSDNSGKHLVNDPTAERSADGKTIVWKIEAPRPNWIYKMSWEW